jgi:hypothetical protein
MKNVAFLLRGAISKTKGAMMTPSSLYSSDEYVDFNSCQISIKKHIVDINPDYNFDFFIQSWNPDLKNDLLLLYNPIDYIFENNDDYKDSMCKILEKTQTDLVYYSNLSQLLSIKLVCNLVENYIKKTNKKYDLFVIYRPDLLLWKNMYLNEYDISKIYCNNNAGSNTGDFHFVMSYDNMLKFKNIYDAVSINLKPIHHEVIPSYINKQQDVILVPDNIKAGIDQEVIRKLNSIKYRAPTLLSILPEYGLTEKQIDRYVS